MARTYQQFLGELSTAQLHYLERQKLKELMIRGPERSSDWRRVRDLELQMLRAEIQMRGEQLSLISD